jgi:hypothetical protein
MDQPDAGDIGSTANNSDDDEEPCETPDPPLGIFKRIGGIIGVLIENSPWP